MKPDCFVVSARNHELPCRTKFGRAPPEACRSSLRDFLALGDEAAARAARASFASAAPPFGGLAQMRPEAEPARPLHSDTCPNLVKLTYRCVHAHPKPPKWVRLSAGVSARSSNNHAWERDQQATARKQR